VLSIGEISIGEKLGGGGGNPNIRDGAQANTSKNNVTANPTKVFIFNPPFDQKLPTTIETLSKDFIITFLSSVPRLRHGVLR
jgi:hypothetical protein